MAFAFILPAEAMYLTSLRVVQRLRLLLLEASAFLTERDELLVVAASTLLCSLSHSALRPVLPVFAKVQS